MTDHKSRKALKEEGWKDMSTLLDIHMPHETTRPVIWWHWFVGVAALLLAVGIPLSFLIDRKAADTPHLVQQGQLPGTEEEDYSISGDGMENGQASSQELTSVEKEIGRTGTSEQMSGRSLFEMEFSNRSKKNTNALFSGVDISDHKEKEIGRSVKEARKSGIGMVDANGMIHNSDNKTVNNLRSLVFYLEASDMRVAHTAANVPNKIAISKYDSKIKASAFTEIFWSLTDHFGFVNAGPAVAYDLGKWSIGLSGGLAVPLPHQKSFYASNIPFSKQYNFTSSRVENTGFDFSSSAEFVYYEGYSMKPGFVFGLSAQRQLSHQWSAGVSMGRIGFRYDFTQKAEPNQSIAANTEQINLRNKLWYGGIAINYHIGEHWSMQGGVRFINLLNAGQVGVLPALRLEYDF